MKIGFKLLTGYLLMALFTAVTGAVGMISANQVKQAYVQSTEVILPLVENLEDLRYSGTRLLATTLEVIMLEHVFGFDNRVETAATSDIEAIELAIAESVANEQQEFIEEAVKPYLAAYKQYTAIIATHFPEKQEALQQLIMAGTDLKTQGEMLINLAQQDTSLVEILAAKEELETAERTFIRLINQAIDYAHADLEKRRIEITLIIGRGITIIGLTSFLALILASALGILQAHTIAGPIAVLKQAVNAFGQGELTARAAVQNQNEIGLLVRAFNRMADEISSMTKYLDNVINSIPDAMFITDRDGVITKANAAASTLLGYQKSELIGQPLQRLHLDDASSFPTGSFPLKMEQCCYNPATDIEWNYRTKDSRAVPVSASIAALNLTADRTTDETVIIAKDITERKQSEQALLKKTRDLERSNQELDQFAYVASHDLKAPLRAIANLSQWIQEDLETELEDNLPDDISKQMNLLRGRVHRMEALINGLLEYSRVGRVAIEAEPVDTAALLQEVIDLLPIPEHFSITIGEQMPKLHTAHLRLSQVFSNLIGNAIKYHDRPDGRLEISVKDANAFYAFMVADDGPGIAPQYHEKVFTIFQTLTPRDQVEGTGIGLTLVKKIVEEQGGSITLESDLGKGTRFCFTWPKEKA
ncbi:MAG: PAS domain S-box protein [Cyanothece sp. SIO1E1]|nr:PAS domain S-box protein [Cyanothece sp. SIO1E1]